MQDPVKLSELEGQLLGQTLPATEPPDLGVARCTYKRDLTPLDLQQLNQVPATVEEPAVSTISYLRDSHHEAARLVARGHKNIDIAAILGFSPSHIGSLKKDPTFRDMVKHYKERAEVQYGKVIDRLILLGRDAVAEIHRRLNCGGPEQIKNRELIKLINSMLDRTGHPAVSQQDNKDVNMSSSMIEAIKAEIAEQNEGVIIEHTTYKSRSKTTLTPHNSGPKECEVIEVLPIKPEDTGPTQAPEGQPQERPTVREESDSLPKAQGSESNLQPVVLVPRRDNAKICSDRPVHDNTRGEGNTSNRMQANPDNGGISSDG